MEDSTSEMPVGTMPVVYDETVSAQVLNSDLKTIEEWAYQWKMQFNPDVNKQAVQVIVFSKEI